MEDSLVRFSAKKRLCIEAVYTIMGTCTNIRIEDRTLQYS